jgi:glycosyltransferase involved in cell wall biosynthesis
MVPHGLPKDLLRFSQRPGQYLSFLGRIAPEKRSDRAIAVARQAGMGLRMAAKIDAVDREYFHEYIEPLLSAPGAEFIGEISEMRKSEFLGNAAALLLPIDWPEPFGLVIIEAMACGTPVIAWDNGAVRELLEPGVTGFIVNSEDQALEAVRRLRDLDRVTIRGVFERRFTAARMARRYLELYRHLAIDAGHRARCVPADEPKPVHPWNDSNADAIA